MVKKVEIVALTAQTADLLQRIADGVFDGPVREDYLTAFLREQNHHMYLALCQGEVVGMASAVVYLHPDKPRNLWINEVGVADAWRRRGIGRKLMDAMLDLSEELGCEEAWLGTETDNVPALALYRSIDTSQEDAGVYFTWDTELD